MRKLLSILLIAVILTTATNLVPTPIFKAEVVHATVVYEPFPGYNIYYAPYYYDPNVVKIQSQLNFIGGDLLWCGEPDGYFGDLTRTAVLHFQMQEELVQDGIVGQITWTRLFSYDHYGY